ncbi:hypothetical protein TNIN_322761, partial [Trichonephila inaurata madagascariensis]
AEQTRPHTERLKPRIINIPPPEKGKKNPFTSYHLSFVRSADDLRTSSTRPTPHPQVGYSLPVDSRRFGLRNACCPALSANRLVFRN